MKKIIFIMLSILAVSLFLIGCGTGKATEAGSERVLEVAPAVCGNAILEGSEQCDDGNIVPGDGCSSTCQFERCGNGIVDVGEQCDDGNTVPGDGCSSTCQNEEKEEPVVGCCAQLVGSGCQETDETSCGDLNGAFTQGGSCNPSGQCVPKEELEKPFGCTTNGQCVQGGQGGLPPGLCDPGSADSCKKPETATTVPESCQPKTQCDSWQCGNFFDGCGGVVQCGGCSTSALTCENNVCV